MKDYRYQQNLWIKPLISPVDTTENAVATPYVDLRDALWCTFNIFFGTITGDSAQVTMEASTDGSSNATEEAIGFSYRLSPAVGTDTDAIGAVTAATSDGVSVAASDDDKILFVEINPAAVSSAKGNDFRFVRAVITPATTAMSACEVAAWCVIEPHFAQTSIKYST